MSFRSLKGWSRGFVSVLLLTVAGCGFPGGNGPGGGGSGGGGGFGAKAPTLLNLADAAPDRVIALSLHISEITMHQSSGASLTALNNAGGLTVEMTHRQALFEPINLDTGDIAQGTYDSVIITLSSAGTVTWVDDLGVIRQDVAPTITSTPVTVPLAANLIVSTAATPVVLNVQFLPSSVAINTGTNH